MLQRPGMGLIKIPGVDKASKPPYLPQTPRSASYFLLAVPLPAGGVDEEPVSP